MKNQTPDPNPRRSLSSEPSSNTINHTSDLLPQLVLIAGSIIILVLCQIIRKDIPPESRLILKVIIPICLVLFLFGIWSIEKSRLPLWMEKSIRVFTTWMNITTWQAITLIFSLLFSMLTCVAAGFSGKMVHPQLAVLCWGAGILLAIFGAAKPILLRQKVSLPVVFTGLAFMILSFAIRAFNSRTIPIVLSGDEASSGLFSLNFLNGNMDNIFVTGWFSFPSFHNFLQSLSITLFSQTTQALRLLSAFSGALTVVIVFFVGRAMFGALTGILSALFLTCLHLHLNFSRIGLNNIWDGFFITLVVGCLWIGWQHNKRAAYIVAGFGLGLSQYFYTSSRVLVLIIPLWLLTSGICDRDRLRKAIPNLLLMFWTTLIVVLPLGWFFIKHPEEFMAPMNRVGILGEWMTQTMLQTGQSKITIILKQLWLAVLGYVELPLRAWYEPGVPALRSIPSILFMLGILFMLLHPKDSRNQLIVYWLGGITLAVGLSESTPAAQRFVAASPAIALMVGFCLKRIGDIVLRFLPKAVWFVNIVLILVMAFLSFDEARFYFFEYTPNSNFSGFNGQVAQRLANRLQDEPAGLELVFCGYPNMGYNSINSLPYLAPQIKYFNMDTNWQAIETPKPTGNRILFAFLPNHDSDIQMIEQEYPGGSWSQETLENGDLLYQLYEYNTLEVDSN